MSKNRKAEVEAAQKTLDLKNKKYQLELDTSAGKIRPMSLLGTSPICWAWPKLAITTG